MPTVYAPRVIEDLDHNQLELQPVRDALFIRTIFSPQLQWQFGPAAVRKLRDVCNAFLGEAASNDAKPT